MNDLQYVAPGTARRTRLSSAFCLYLLLCCVMPPGGRAQSQSDGPAPTQASCTYTLTPPSPKNYPEAGGSGNIAVTPSDGSCAWTATTGDPWISITGGASGVGSGFVSYSVAANTGAARSGSILVGDQSYTITQDLACSITIFPLLSNIPHFLSTGDVFITAAAPHCAWLATSNTSWISLVAPVSGTGSSTLSYRVEQNFGAARTGSITIADKTYTINQGASPDFTKLEGYLLGTVTLTTQEKLYADINYDGNIDAADLLTAIGRSPAPGAVYWISSLDGNWSDGANWSTGMVPGPSDYVIIDSPAVNPITVTINQNITVSNLHVPASLRFSSRDNIKISGATLTVTGPVEFGGNLTMENNAAIDAEGEHARVAGLGTAQMTNSRLIAHGGGVVRWLGPATFNWTTVANPTFFEASGRSASLVDSLVSLPKLTTLTFNSGGASNITAYALAGYYGQGGRVDLSGLQTVTLGTNHKFSFNLSTGGSIDASAFTSTQGLVIALGAGTAFSLPAVTGTLTAGTIDVAAGGTLTLPLVTSLNAETANVSGAMTAPLMTSVGSSTLAVAGVGVLAAAGLTSMTDTNVGVDATGLFDAPALTSYTSTTGAHLLDVVNGGMFDAPLLSTVTNLRFRARSGGSLILPAVTSYLWNLVVNPTIFDAYGKSAALVDSLLSLPNLTTLTFNSGGASNITAYALAGYNAPGGHIDLSGLQTVTLGTNHKFSFYLSNGGSIDASAFTSTQGLVLTVTAGSTFSLPAVAGTLTNGSIDISAGGTLTLPAATGLNAETVNVSGVFTAPLMTSIAGSTANVAGVGVLTAAGLTSMTNTNVTVDATGKFDAQALTSYTSTTGAHLLDVVTDGLFDAPMLATVTNLRFRARSGGSLTLPGVTSYLWNLVANPTIFEVYGKSVGLVDSMLSLPNLTTLVFNSGGASNITAYALAGYSGAGGHIDLSGLQTVTLGLNHKFSFYLANGSSIDASDLTSIQGLVLTLTAGASFTLPSVTGTLSGGAIDVAAGATLSLPAVTGINAETLTISGTLTSAALTSITSSAVTVQGAGGLFTANALTSMTDVNTTVDGTGTFNAPALTSYTSTTGAHLIDVVNTGTFSAPLLATITNLRFRARSGGALTLPGATSYLWNLVANPTIFDVYGKSATLVDSLIALPNLTSLTFNSGGASTITAYALPGYSSPGGHLDLSGLQTITLGLNHRFAFDPYTSGTIDASALTSTQGLALMINAGASLSLPAITGTLSNGSIDVAAGGALTLGAATGISETVNVNGTLAAPALTTMTNANTTVDGTGTFTAPLLTSYTSTTGGHLLDVVNGGTFDAPSLATVTNLRFRARSGGALTLPGVTSYLWNLVANPTIFDVYGQSATLVDSLIALPNMTSLTFNTGGASNITAYAVPGYNSPGGHLDISGLQTITLGVNHKFSLDPFTTGTIDASALTSTQGLALTVNTGASLSLPAITGTLSNGSIDVAAGGTLTLGAATGISEPVNVNGTLTTPSLTTMSNMTTTVDGTGIFSAPALTSYTSTTGAHLLDVANGGTFNAPLLATATNLRFRARSGGMLSLPGMTSYLWNLVANPTIFDISGQSATLVSSSMAFPNLTHITFNSGGASNITGYVVAATTGQLNMSALTTITLGTNHMFNFGASGAGTVINLTALTPVPAGVTLNPTSGGVIQN